MENSNEWSIEIGQEFPYEIRHKKCSSWTFHPLYYSISRDIFIEDKRSALFSCCECEELAPEYIITQWKLLCDK